MKSNEYRFLHGDSLYKTQKLGEEKGEKGKYRLVVTSPPYYKQREYGCSEDEIGQEKTVEEYIDNLVDVFLECRELLADDGSLFVVIADKKINGSKLMIPHRLAIALTKVGYVFREDIVWYKRNALPSSSKSSLAQNYEMILFFSKNKKPYLDMDGVRVKGSDLVAGKVKVQPASKLQYKAVGRDEKEVKRLCDIVHSATPEMSFDDLPTTDEIARAYGYDPEKYCPACHRKFRRHATRKRMGGHAHYPVFAVCNPLGKNPGNVWEVSTKSHKGGEHFAIFPEDLIARIVKFTTEGGDWVLDPFVGRGTVGIVCACLKRKFTGMDLYWENIVVAKRNVKDALENKIPQQVLDQIVTPEDKIKK